MNLLANIFSVKSKERNIFQIILWWEYRRIIFNIVLILGIASCLRILKIDLATVELGDGEYILFLFLVAFAIFANFVYTFGWVIEIIIQRSVTFGPTVFKRALLLTGLCFAAFISWILYTSYFA